MSDQPMTDRLDAWLSCNPSLENRLKLNTTSGVICISLLLGRSKESGAVEETTANSVRGKRHGGTFFHLSILLIGWPSRVSTALHLHAATGTDGGSIYRPS